MCIRDRFWDNWRKRKGFDGFPWLWSHISNYGANIGLHGRLDAIATGPIDGRKDPEASPSMKGTSSTPEGIEVNPVVFDLLNEMRWRDVYKRQILNTCCIENALINMGNSSVLALGDHPAGTGWKVNFGNRLETDKIGMKQSVLLCNECLTTSGNESDGRKHIISPHDASFVEGIKQIAVVTKNGAVGEILSTALFAASPEQREALLVNLRPLLIDYFLIGY